MRGALKKLPGIQDIAIQTGAKPFKVKYDANKVSVDTMLTALKAAGEGAMLQN